MEAWEARLETESRELMDKMNKLVAFLNAEESLQTLREDEIKDLKDQLRAMTAYSDILRRRLDRLEQNSW